MLTKNNNALSDLENNRKYHFLADPTLRLAIPRLVMQIDSINGKPVSNATFDTLQALSKVTVTASIRDNNGSRSEYQQRLCSCHYLRCRTYRFGV